MLGREDVKLDLYSLCHYRLLATAASLVVSLRNQAAFRSDSLFTRYLREHGTYAFNRSAKKCSAA